MMVEWKKKKKIHFGPTPAAWNGKKHHCAPSVSILVGHCLSVLEQMSHWEFQCDLYNCGILPAVTATKPKRHSSAVLRQLFVPKNCCENGFAWTETILFLMSPISCCDLSESQKYHLTGMNFFFSLTFVWSVFSAEYSEPVFNVSIVNWLNVESARMVVRSSRVLFGFRTHNFSAWNLIQTNSHQFCLCSSCCASFE